MGNVRILPNKWSNLDIVMVKLHSNKSNKKDRKTVYVNSYLFCLKSSYMLQLEDSRYAASGMLDRAWNLISHKKYKEADQILDKILVYWKKSSSLYYAKFVTSLYMDGNYASYLIKCIECKRDSALDYDLRLYIDLVKELVEIDYDLYYEYLCPPKKLVAFNKNSYNGCYISFLNCINNREYNEAKNSIRKCMELKPYELSLVISDYLVDLIIVKERERKEKLRIQEKELSTSRISKFINEVNSKQFAKARESLELIIAYRNSSDRNNSIYYLFLELLEMIYIASNDITYEVMPVDYTYKTPTDFFKTFQEAVSIGDFVIAYEAGQKCKNKVLDRDYPKLKVAVYLKLLEEFNRIIEENQNEIDNIYQIVETNIYKGRYTHAKELFNANEVSLRSYQAELIQVLFNEGIKFERHIPITYEEEVEEYVEDDELDSIPLEVQNEDNVLEENISLQLEQASKREEEKMEFLDELPSEYKLEDEEELPDIHIRSEDTIYEVKPLLNHFEPNHEFFQYYLQSLALNNLDDARYWLSQFNELLKENYIEKRLDHYYYAIEVRAIDLDSEIGAIREKELMYSNAYNAFYNNHYDKVLYYLDYFERLNSSRDLRGKVLKGYTYIKMGKYKNAIEVLMDANTISPSPDAYYLLADSYYKEHNYKDAVFCYLTYNEFYPKESPYIYLSIAECYRNLNKKNKVLKYLRIADEINKMQNGSLNIERLIKEAEYEIEKGN